MAFLGFRSIVLVLSLASAFSACPSDVCDCSNYASIKEIRCISRQLLSVPANLPSDTQTLRLEFNNITAIDVNDLVNLSALKRLTLYNNQISTIAANAFASQQNLEWLKMENNDIANLARETFQGLGKLLELNLDNNHLATILNGTFKHLLKLTELTMSGNPLQSLPTGIFSELSNLHTLDISHINFQTIPSTLFEGLAQLRNLIMNSITDNGDEMLDEAVFSSITNLTNFEVKNNSLSCIPSSFSVLRSLQSLTLSQNAMTCDDFSVLHSFPFLRDLVLENTNMTKLTSRMFANNSHLQFLHIADSKLISVEDNAFIGLGELTDLLVYSNNLTTLPNNIFSPLPTSVHLDVAENPWHCDCNLRWLRQWLVDIPSVLQPVCATPDRVSTRQLVVLNNNDFACMPERVATNTSHAVNEGDDARLECGIAGDPMPQLQWLTPDHTIVLPGISQPPFYLSHDGVLTIVRIRYEDSGSYSCIGTNVAGSLSVVNVVTVVAKGISVEYTTTSTSTTTNKQQTTLLKATVPSTMASTGTGSLPVYIIVILVVLVVFITSVLLGILYCTRSRRKRNNHQEGFIITNEPAFGSGICNQPCSEGYVVGNLDQCDSPRYAKSLSRPACSPYELPPPYTPQQSMSSMTYDQIYDRIDDGNYETPMTADTLTRQAPVLNHTYVTHLKQSSDSSNYSGVVPDGHARSLNPRYTTPTSTGATVNLHTNPVDQNDRQSSGQVMVENPTTVHYHNSCASNGLLPKKKGIKTILQERDVKDDEATGTYQNVARNKPLFSNSNNGK